MTVTPTTTNANTNMPDSWDRMRLARWAGGLYLAFILANVLASLTGHIGLASTQTLHQTISVKEPMFRIGLVAALASALLFVVTAWALATLLRPVDRSLAILLLILNAVGVAIQCASYLPLLAALAQRDSGVNLQALTDQQLDGLGMLSVTTYHGGFLTAQLFFSAWLFPLSWLVIRSGFLPRILGWILFADGIGVLIWFLQSLLVPTLPAISYPTWVLSLVAELGLALWLLIKGTHPDPRAHHHGA